MKKGTYTTETGKVLSILPGSPFQLENYRLAFTEQFEAENPRPPQPTYQTETAGGGYEILAMDESSAETPEQKAEVEAFKNYQSRLDTFVNTKLLDVLIVENVEADPNADADWLKKRKFFGVKLPTDDLELKLYYIKELLVFSDVDGGDFNRLPVAIMQLSGIRPQAVDAGRATFRGSLRRSRRNANRENSTAAEGQMVDEPTLSGDEDGESVGADS